MDLRTLADISGSGSSKVLDALEGWAPNRVAALDDLPRSEWPAILGRTEISREVLGECESWALHDFGR